MIIVMICKQFVVLQKRRLTQVEPGTFGVDSWAICWNVRHGQCAHRTSQNFIRVKKREERFYRLRTPFYMWYRTNNFGWLSKVLNRNLNHKCHCGLTGTWMFHRHTEDVRRHLTAPWLHSSGTISDAAAGDDLWHGALPLHRTGANAVQQVPFCSGARREASRHERRRRSRIEDALSGQTWTMPAHRNVSSPTRWRLQRRKCWCRKW